MIQEAYVSFETAKLLKDKGFEVPFFFYYRTDDEVKNIHHAPVAKPLSYYQKYIDGEVVAAPTHQMAMKWLREVYGIHVSAIPCAERHTIVWQQNIINLKPIKEGGMFLQLEPNRINYNSYEEAVEAAIKYSLENLI